jgi:pyridoxal phosphate enzyme (YggS family)
MSAPPSIAESVERIRERIDAAARRSGRDPAEVRLMAVSKFHGASAVGAAYGAGIRLFGESRVQEAREKFAVLKTELPGIELHLIGSLQRNKAKQAAELFSCVQSADRDEILAELSRRAEALGRTLDILIELHTGEESKAGYPDFDSLRKAVELTLSLPALRFRGLMTMAPYTEDPVPIRASFRALRAVRDRLRAMYPEADPCVLSMGMTNDFEIAVEEGSTLVRVGTAIFGPRPVAGGPA